MKGQAVLAVLLITAVIVTVVLSVVSYSVTDVTLSSKEEEALRAFSAAEAGIERALVGDITVSSGEVSIGESKYNVAVSSEPISNRQFVYPAPVASGDTATVWFVSHDNTTLELSCKDLLCFKGDGGQIQVCWGDSGVSPTPALVVEIYYSQPPGEKGSLYVARDSIDPVATRRAVNRFSEPGSGTCTIGGVTFANQKIINFDSLGIPQSSYRASGGLVLITLRLLYNSEPQSVGVNAAYGANTALPAQGRLIQSSGVSGEANRKIEVFRLYPEVPSIFSGVYSPLDLVK